MKVLPGILKGRLEIDPDRLLPWAGVLDRVEHPHAGTHSIEPDLARDLEFRQGLLKTDAARVVIGLSPVGTGPAGRGLGTPVDEQGQCPLEIGGFAGPEGPRS